MAINLNNEIKKAISVKKSDLSGILKLIKTKRDSKNQIRGDFFLIECDAQQVREEDFIEVISDQILNYCLTYSENSSINSKNALRRVSQAVRKFVEGKNSGELGELILFCLLESQLNAVQILNKMALKTSPRMYYHGFDAVHFGLDDSFKCLYLGESKTYEKFEDALDKAIKDVDASFEDNSKKQFEVELIKTHLDERKLKNIRKDILNCLNPYKKKNEYLEKIVIFIGYSWDEINKRSSSNEDPMEYLTKKYKVEISDFLSKINKKIKESNNLKNKHFVFFLIPFSDISKIRERFQEKIKSK